MDAHKKVVEEMKSVPHRKPVTITENMHNNW